MRWPVAVVLCFHALARGDAAVGVDAPVAEAEARRVLDAWLAAQTQRDFDAYAALYARPFHGVRRSGRRTVALDRDGWLNDRRRMFAKPFQVAADGVQFAAGPPARLRFTQ